MTNKLTKNMTKKELLDKLHALSGYNTALFERTELALRKKQDALYNLEKELLDKNLSVLNLNKDVQFQKDIAKLNNRLFKDLLVVSLVVNVILFSTLLYYTS